jgi:[protein-PII] uridylyltransferase
VPSSSFNVLRHREKVLAHAEQQLRSAGKLNTAELISLYQKFLKIENHRIRLKHQAGGGGREICGQRASLVDIVLRHLLEAALGGDATFQERPAELALVAIGGYGRGELNPFSDIDVMFLVEEARGKLEPRINDVIQKILYMLWDVGFKVGHSTRTIASAIGQANADMLSKTSLLEARLVAGDERLFADFRQQFVKKCVAGHVEDYIRDRVLNQTERHEKFGRTVYMQEPNVKNGCGSLRDYQNLLWISFFKERVQTTAGLVEKKLLNENERRLLERAYDFLLRVRTELHYFNKRSTDLIVLSQQLHIANKLNYPQKNILRRSEAFMRDYYQHARNIYHITELLCERLSVPIVPPSPRPEDGEQRGLLGFLRKATTRMRTEHFDGFYSADGRIYYEARDLFNQEPARMMRLFQHLQLRKLRMSPDLQQLVRRRLHLVDRTFQYAKATRETFTAICSRKGEVGAILRAMHKVDFLGRYVPEFGQLTCLVQHEFFHRYTADEHTLVCIEKLDRLIDTEDPKLVPYKELFQKIEDPFVLYLALLLHDTGKASNARTHAEASALFAQKVSRRLQLNPEQRRSLVLLVDQHILMSSTAQRRNLDDPATIAEFAALIKNQANLDALMLLTLADGQGTGDENWSDWKENLVWQLYRSTSLYLADGEAFYRQRTIERKGLHEALSKKLPADYGSEIDAHFEYMPDRYFQTYSVAEIVEHVRLFRKFLAARFSNDNVSLAPAIKWIARPNSGHSEVWFCGWNRRELLARIAGSFSCVQLNILGADIFTRGDSLVLDIFRVCNTKYEAVTDEREMAAVERRLHQALATEDFDFGADLAKARKRRGFQLSNELDFPTRITIDNFAHPVYTLVDIQAPDRLGLLHRILRAFGEVDVQIALSRITTEKGAAIDSFYVTDQAGKKLKSGKSIERLQQALRNATQIPLPA